MAGSLGFRRQYCIPKGKASAGYHVANHLRSGGKALRRADRCRECRLEFFRQRVSNDTDLGDLAGETFGDLAGGHLERGQLLQSAVGFL
jgi:hypothetical protein